MIGWLAFWRVILSSPSQVPAEQRPVTNPIFLTQLNAVLDKFPPSRIYNVNETGITTVLMKTIHSVFGTRYISHRRTGSNWIRAHNSPYVLFSMTEILRVVYKRFTTGYVDAINCFGWLTSTEFLTYIVYFIKHTRPSPSDHILLLLVNQQSHFDIKMVGKAKSNSIVMLSLRPQCWNKCKIYCAKT